jgi:hypothetical protein
MTIKILSYNDLLKFQGNVLYKRFLYLIKQHTTWDEYFLIACVLSKLEVPLEEFKEWASLHPEYNLNDGVIISYEEKFKNYNKSNCYSIKHLQKLARQSELEFFKESAEDLNSILYDLNIDDTFYIIKENTKYIKQDKNIIIKNNDANKTTINLIINIMYMIK